MKMEECQRWGFPHSSASKESACTAGDLGLIPGLERSPGEGKGYVLQYSGLESSMDLSCSPLSCKELDMTEQLTLLPLFCPTMKMTICIHILPMLMS